MTSVFFYSILLISLSWMRQIDSNDTNASKPPDTYISSLKKNLTSNSSTLFCPGTTGNRCYYQVFSLNVLITADYDVVIESDLDIDVYLYYLSFNPNQSNTNLIHRYHKIDQEDKMKFTIRLNDSRSVILVLTIQHPLSHDSYKITIQGPSVVNFETIQDKTVEKTTTSTTQILQNDLSPLIQHFSWGRVVVEGQKQIFKDVKLFPGGSSAYTEEIQFHKSKTISLYSGAVPWDWRKTGTRHKPGIQPADLEELFDHNCDIIILSRGVIRKLHTMEETRRFLERYGKKLEEDYFILRTRQAVKLYNELATRKERVCAVIHSTC